MCRGRKEKAEKTKGESDEGKQGSCQGVAGIGTEYLWNSCQEGEHPVIVAKSKTTQANWVPS